MSDTETAVELHVVSQDSEETIGVLNEFCEVNGIRVIRCFWRNIEPDEWELLEDE